MILPGDGIPDLWATRTAGTVEDLEFAPGTATGFAPAVTIGSGGRQWIGSLG